MENNKKTYRMIENMLDDIALARRAMILLDGEEPKKIDDFISSIGAKKIEEADKLNSMELIIHMAESCLERKDKLDKRGENNEK